MKKIEFIMLFKNEIEILTSLASQLSVEEFDQLVQSVIDTKNVEYIYKFACNVENAPIEKLADAIIYTKNVEYIYKFARDIENAPVEKLADAIIDTKNAEYIYRFACNVKNAPIEKLADAVIAIGDHTYIFYFLCYVKNAPFNKLNLKLHELEENDLTLANREIKYKVRKLVELQDMESLKQILDSFEGEHENPETIETGTQKIYNKIMERK